MSVSDATAVPVLSQGTLKIYPNPGHDEVTIDFGKIIEADVLLIELISMNGQLFYQETKELADGKIKPNLGSLPRGGYLVRINHEVIKDRMILQ